MGLWGICIEVLEEVDGVCGFVRFCGRLEIWEGGGGWLGGLDV